MTTPMRVLGLSFIATLAACGSAPGSSAPDTVAAEGKRAAPALERMRAATVSGKIGAPVEVRYLVTSAVTKDQPANVELAFVPTMAGTNLQVEFPATEGVTLEKGSEPMRVQKSAAAEVHRRQLFVTASVESGATMRAVVSIDVPEGRFFSVFVIPLDDSATAPRAKKAPGEARTD